MRRSPARAAFSRAAAALCCALVLSAPARALSSAEQTSSVSIRLIAASYEATGLDASAEVSITGHYAPESHASASGDGTGSGSAEASVNGAPVAPFESFAFGVGDRLRVSQTSAASASTPEGTSDFVHRSEWVLEAASPLLGDVRLEFGDATGIAFALHNDTEGSSAAVSLDSEASIEDSFGNEESVSIDSIRIALDEPGSYEGPMCSGAFCSGEFEPPFTLTLRANALPSTISITSDASSAVEVAPLPEPGAGLMLAAGALALAVLARRR